MQYNNFFDVAGGFVLTHPTTKMVYNIDNIRVRFREETADRPNPQPAGIWANINGKTTKLYNVDTKNIQTNITSENIVFGFVTLTLTPEAAAVLNPDNSTALKAGNNVGLAGITIPR